MENLTTQNNNRPKKGLMIVFIILAVVVVGALLYLIALKPLIFGDQPLNPNMVTSREIPNTHIAGDVSIIFNIGVSPHDAIDLAESYGGTIKETPPIPIEGQILPPPIDGIDYNNQPWNIWRDGSINIGIIHFDNIDDKELLEKIELLKSSDLIQSAKPHYTTAPA